MTLRARDVLSRDSPLARSLPHYRERSAQLAMADGVEAALAFERPLFVEAGTGTGKTLAYLVPAVLSGKKVVVSTATRALQEQIYGKDLPLVAGALSAHGVHFRAALMKGLTNYLCKRRLAELGTTDAFAWADPDAAGIEAWAKVTDRGDRAELASLAEDASAWRSVQSSSETRIGGGCRFFEECFVTAMKREAEHAQLVVVNHHLFFADLALRARSRGDYASVIPAYDAVVFDEAHEVEDIATEFFGVRLSSARLEALARDAERAELSSDQAGLAARAFFDALGGTRSNEARRVLRPGDWSEAIERAAAKLDLALLALAARAEARSKGADAALQIARRANDARADLSTVTANLREDDLERAGARVAWVQSGARSVSVGASPVELGHLLRGALFERVRTIICTSATLATGGGGSPSCHFAKARLGAPPDAGELVLPSPFDFASHAALYLPRDLPDPADPAFESAAAERVVLLVRMTGGGAFVLCTSSRAMRRMHDAIRQQLGQTPVLLQGEAPKHTLIERFKRAGDAVLVATMSFWEGVDVPGRALRLVVLDKIPFAVPTDPVVMARCARVERDGGNAFTQYSVPSAAITLKQGFGRLLRTESDRGIVAILDRRITSRGYGPALVASLPPATRISSLDDVRAFWARAEAQPAASPPG